MPTFSSRNVWSALALMVFVACSESDQAVARAAPTAQIVTRTDSVGIEIVQIANLDTAALETWTVGSDPVTVIGDDEKGDAHVLTFTAGQLRMNDGRVIVAMNNEIREFDSTGTFIRNIAREGRGPGEFSDLSALRRIGGDTLLAYQRYPTTVTMFSPSGNFVSTSTVIRPKAREDFPSTTFKAAYPDGSLLIERRPPGEHSSELGVVWSDSVRPQRVDLKGNVIGEFPKLWDHDVTRVAAITGSVPAGKEAFLGSMPARPRGTSWGLAGDQLFYSTRETFEIQLWSGDGKLRRIVRMPVAAIPRTLADSQVRHFQGATYDYATVMPATMPPIHVIESDREHNLWVWFDSRAFNDGATSLIVIDSTGQPIARSTSSPFRSNVPPRRFRIVSNFQDIDRDRITTMALDSDDRVYVLVLPLKKTAALHATKQGVP